MHLNCFCDIPQHEGAQVADAMLEKAVLLSHDDRTAADRRLYRSLGADVAEFPMSREAVESAGRAGR